MGSAISVLFDGLDRSAINSVIGRMRPRYFDEGEHVCREGEIGEAMYLIDRGLVEVQVGRGRGMHVISRLREGEVFGEMALLTEAPRAATIETIMPTLVLELDRSGFADVCSRYPRFLINLTRMLIDRQNRNTSRLLADKSVDLVGLAIGRGTEALVERVINAVLHATRRQSAVVDTTGALTTTAKVPLQDASLATVIPLIDQLRLKHDAIIAVAYADCDGLRTLLRCMDRRFVIGDEADIYRCADILTGLGPIEAVQTSGNTPITLGAPDTINVIRRLDNGSSDDVIAWFGRHLARAKIGIAFGAGGAKGFAHLGVISVLQRAGFTADVVTGSSIGAITGTMLALGLGLEEMDERLRSLWSDEHVELLPQFTPEGISSGMLKVLDGISDMVGSRSLPDLQTPLGIMTADLEHGEAVPIIDGGLYEALTAALAIPGLMPPYKRQGRRLVDAVCLTPVPTHCARELGADIVVAVNLLNRQRAISSPGEPPPPRRSPRRNQNLDPVIEALMMLQIDTSGRNAAEADVVITPRFAPSSWRDFHLADLFREAGREAAEGALAQLQALVRPAATAAVC